MQAISTLCFPGCCDEALSFYRDAIGAVVLFHHRVGDIVDPAQVKPGTAHRTLRAGLRIGDTRFYLADGHAGGGPVFQGVALTLACASAAEAAGMLAALADGGNVQVPLRSTAWAEVFGTVVDRFGLHWTVEAGVRHGAA
jgi:PhnB protein